MESTVPSPKAVKPVPPGEGDDDGAGSRTRTCGCHTATDVAAVAVATRMKLSVLHYRVIVTVAPTDTVRTDAVFNPKATSR